MAGYPTFEGSKTVFGSRFPVFAIRSERLFGYDTIGPVFDFLTWSMNTMYSGTFPAKNLTGDDLRSLGPNMSPNDPMYNGYKFRLVELRGDWKHHVHSFKLVNHWACNDLCHCCKASKTNRLYPYIDFTRQPKWLSSIRTHAEFLAEQLNEPINSLIYTARFDYRFIRFCSVHTIQLGIAQFCHGGCFFELFKVGWFPGDDKASKMRHAFIRFKEFIRKHKIECSQPPFKSYMYVTSGEEYCYFGSKASWHDFNILDSDLVWILRRAVITTHYIPITTVVSGTEAYNSRVITSWLADECCKAYEQHPTERMLLTYTCVHALHAWYCDLEQYSRYLTQPESWLRTLYNLFCNFSANNFFLH